MNSSLRSATAMVLVALLVLAGSPIHAEPPDSGPPGRGNQPSHPHNAAPMPPHPDNACSSPYHIHGAGWDFCWQQDDLRVQGLEINRAFFHNESVIWKMGLPFTLTKYERTSPGPFKDVLGRSGDANLPGFGLGSMEIGEEACPRFLPEGELFNDGRVCVEHRGGVFEAVSIWARYDVYNYRFLQGYHFDDRGIIEPFIALGGLLIDGMDIGADGQNHYHHIYWRVDFDIGSPGGDVFQVFNRGGRGASVGSIGIPDPGPAIGTTSSSQQTGSGLCEPVGGEVSATMWCDLIHETKLHYHQALYNKWRVKDSEDLNEQDRAKSFEFTVRSDARANEFATFDVMILEHQGDDEEIGHEIPSVPRTGDAELNMYMIPPEPVSDPVVWIAFHHYHDTRDEDRESMSHHYASFTMRPLNFLDENPAESTFP